MAHSRGGQEVLGGSSSQDTSRVASPAWSRSHQAPYGKWRLPRGLASRGSLTPRTPARRGLGAGPVGGVRPLCCSPRRRPGVPWGRGTSTAEPRGKSARPGRRGPARCRRLAPGLSAAGASVQQRCTEPREERCPITELEGRWPALAGHHGGAHGHSQAPALAHGPRTPWPRWQWVEAVHGLPRPGSPGHQHRGPRKAAFPGDSQAPGSSLVNGTPRIGAATCPRPGRHALWAWICPPATCGPRRHRSPGGSHPTGGAGRWCRPWGWPSQAPTARRRWAGGKPAMAHRDLVTGPLG